MPEAPDALRDQSILITGGTGTFGRAFVREALAQGARSVVAVGRNSEARYRLEQAHRDDSRLRVLPCRVDVLSDVQRVFDHAGPFDVVVHAAAEKHVGTGEAFKDYTSSVNVNGAYHVSRLARGAACVALSSDKACQPTNYYGETKAMAERIFLKDDHTVVRYGNVVGSSGSVIPLFVQQRATGRITITDRRMTRFFMPVSDEGGWQVSGAEVPPMSAVGLVTYALTHGGGGEIFIPTIPSASIAYLAEQIGPGCVIEETGIRPGEKLHEQLIADDEIGRTYRLPRGVFLILPRPVGYLDPVPADFRYTSDVNPQPLQVWEQGDPERETRFFDPAGKDLSCVVTDADGRRVHLSEANGHA